MSARIGVLALQGDFAAHAHALRGAGALPVEIRVPADLDGCAGLVLPGGESTTLLKLLEPHGLLAAIPAFHREGGALFGTCAGAILLARRVVPAQPALGLIDLVIERNAYGRQRESSEGEALPTSALGALLRPGEATAPLPMLFIRAPRFLDLGPGVEPLATWRGETVLVREDRVWACTGHPELTADLRLHRAFIACATRRPARGAAYAAAGRT
jgi:5'-phosphate synthase pdxT subunit